MAKLDRVQGSTSRAAGKTGEIYGPAPVGVSPVLRRFWDFARKMAKEFGKHLLKNHEEEFLKVVRKDFEKWRE